MMCKNCKHAFCWYCLESLDVSTSWVAGRFTGQAEQEAWPSRCTATKGALLGHGSHAVRGRSWAVEVMPPGGAPGPWKSRRQVLILCL